MRPVTTRHVGFTLATRVMGGRVSRKDQLLSFGRALKAARQAAGLTQQQLADAIPVRRNMVSQWETGMTGAREESVRTLERILGLSHNHLGWFLGYGNPPPEAELNSTVEMIKADPKLSDKVRDIVLRTYEAAIEASQRLGDSGDGDPA